MNEAKPSMTALGSSLIREVHTRSDPQPIFIDAWADQLLPASVKDAFRQVAIAALGHERPSVLDDWIRGNTFYSVLLTRARYTEDALAAAIVRGVRQYVLLGAGFDSFALRRPGAARDVEVYEIDHPATQSYKLERLADCGLSMTNKVHFLAADLAVDSLASVLAAATFDGTRPAFFAWLGVSMYLTREANVATLRAIARCAAPGSELVFTYHDQAFFAADTAEGTGTVAEMKQYVRSVGEPFVSGFAPDELPQVLDAAGFELLEDLDDAQAVHRFDPADANGLRPQPLVRIAHARVR